MSLVNLVKLVRMFINYLIKFKLVSFMIDDNEFQCLAYFNVNYVISTYIVSF